VINLLSLGSCSFETLGTEAEQEKENKMLEQERLRPRLALDMTVIVLCYLRFVLLPRLVQLIFALSEFCTIRVNESTSFRFGVANHR
jgi:hypothetical protein